MTPKLDSPFRHMVARKTCFALFNTEKERSALATVAGIVIGKYPESRSERTDDNVYALTCNSKLYDI